MKLTVLTAVALMALMVPARASTWYTIDLRSGTCEAAKPPIDSPDAFRKGIEKNGFRSTVDITRTDSGKVVIVSVNRYPVNSSTMIGFTDWFPERDYCERFRQMSIKNGTIQGNPNELK